MQSKHPLILRRRIQLAVHSYIYYQLNDNLVSDSTWQAWANELMDLQAFNPDYTDDYDQWFEDWDGTTGFHLCQILGLHTLATNLLNYRDKQEHLCHTNTTY